MPANLPRAFALRSSPYSPTERVDDGSNAHTGHGARVISRFLDLKLPPALAHRLSAIADAGILGRTVDDVVAHFIREALHRDWLGQEANRSRALFPTPASTDRTESQPKVGATPRSLQGPSKRLLRTREVCSRAGIGRTTLYKLVQSGAFPASRRLGERTVAWLESDIEAWIEAREIKK
jgi:prophage regulatory protein